MRLRNYFFPVVMILFAGLTWASVPSLIKLGDRFHANVSAENVVFNFAQRNIAKVPDATMTVKADGEQVTASGKIRRRMYNITYTVGTSSATQRASVTIERKNGVEKPVALTVWPNAQGKMTSISL